MAGPAVAAAPAAAGWGSKALGALKIGGQIVSGLSGLIGGGGGDRSNERKWAITRRVRDAQRAGIHPLYALGSAGASMPSLATGSALGDAIGNLGAVASDYASGELAKRRPRDPLLDAQLEESAARVAAMQGDVRSKDAQAAYYHALTAREAQRLMSTGRDEGAKTHVEVPAQITSHEGGRVSGPPQGSMVEVEIPDTGGRTIFIPNQGAGFEVPESVGAGIMLLRKVYQGLDALEGYWERRKQKWQQWDRERRAVRPTPARRR